MITHESIFKAWKAAIEEILANGEETINQENNSIYQIHNLILRVTKPLVEGRKPIFWLKRYDIDLPLIEEIKYTTFLNEQSPFYAYTIGQKVFNYNKKHDQLHRIVIPRLKKYPQSQQALVMINELTAETSTDIPLINSLHFYIKRKKLHLSAVINNCNLLLAFPIIFIQLTYLLEYITKEMILNTGTITTHILSAYIEKKEEYLVMRLLAKE